jgi:glycosyltransferase involved in cell wall biosynthesis
MSEHVHSPSCDAPAKAGPHQRSPRRISVALCTFNGGRFLEAQLESILAQSRQPTEIVACDDGSTDQTLAILDGFRQRAPFPVRIEHNQGTLGSTKNFEKAIGLCTGELIATSDQDDVWLPDKLALLAAAFDDASAPGLVFSDAEVVDEALRPLGHTMWESIRFGRRARRTVREGRWFDLLLRQWLVTGATMMFRADLRRAVLPIPESWIHDGWCAIIVGALAPLGLVERPLLRYRQHATQQIGGKKLTLRELYAKARELGPVHYRLAYERFLLARERLQSVAGQVRDPKYLALLDEKVGHEKRRLEIISDPSRWRRVHGALRELARGNYRRFSPSMKHFLKDLIL